MQSDGPHFVYKDTNQHLHQLFYNGTWNNQDLTAMTAAPIAAANSSLTSWVQSDGPHFVYEDTNQHLHQLFYNGTWNNQDLTAMTTAPIAE